jgi:hypothetical protein
MFSAYLHYCFYYLRTGQLSLAEPWINRAQHFVPSISPHHHINLLIVQIDFSYYSGDFQQGTAFFQSALKACERINRSYNIPFLKLIQIKNYICLEEFDSASRLFLDVIDYSDHQAFAAHFELANVAIEKGHSNFASVVCTNIIQRFPKDKNPHFYHKTIQLRERHELSVLQVFSESPLRVIRSLFTNSE